MTDLTGLRARVLIAEAAALGIDLIDLAAVTPVPRGPTFAELVASLEPTFTPATAATYRPHWRVAIELVGDRPITGITVVDLQRVVEVAAERAVRRRPASTGRATREATVAALRAVLARAVAAGLVAMNPAAALTKPRRGRSRRRALDQREQHELIGAVRLTSRDPDLDLLVVRFHLETGARRSGALALRRDDLDLDRATVWLREKGDAEREQPVSRPSPGCSTVTTCAALGPTCSSLAATADRSPRTYDRLFVRDAARCSGRPALPCPPMCCATPRSPPSVTLVATRSPRPSLATPHRRSPAAISTPPSARLPPLSP